MEILQELTVVPSPQSPTGKSGVRSIDTGLNKVEIVGNQARTNGSAMMSKATPSTLPPVGQNGHSHDGQSRGFALSLDSLKIFQQAVFNVTPVVEVKSRRVGGSNYQVPLEVNPERGTALALRWLIQAARQRPGREMSTKLANELLDASNKTGNAIRKREETHRMAEANKAFANYRF